MTTPPRLGRSSLLWTFSAAFLIVLVLGALLQVAIVFGVIRPAARHWLHSQGEVLARAGAQAVAGALERDPDAHISDVLATVTDRRGPVSLAYRDATGHLGGFDRPFGARRRDWRGRRGGNRGLEAGADATPRLDDSLHHGSTEAGERGGPAVPGPAGPLSAAPGEPGLRPGRPFPQFGTGPDAPEIGARAPVTVQGRPAGEVLAILPPLASLGWPEGIPRPSLLFVPIAAVLSGAAAYFLFRSLSRRLQRLEEQAERVASGDLDSRVTGLGGDEVGRLAESLNRMTDRLADARKKLAEAEEQRRRFLADAAHELSTPLTTIRGSTETLLDPAVPLPDADRQASLRDILAEAQRMDLLVQDLLDLGRLESGAPEPAPELVDLEGLARECVRRFQAAYREAGLVLAGPGGARAGAGEPVPDAGADPVFVRGVPRRLEQVLENLLLNGLRHVPRGGTVAVSVRRAGSVAHLAVEDDGPGFADEDLPHLFDRFYRVDRSRQGGGTGLGLAIVREIVRRQGGRIAARNRTGGGACVEADLPAAP
jgi:signal transduction histidine kinase